MNAASDKVLKGGVILMMDHGVRSDQVIVDFMLSRRLTLIGHEVRSSHPSSSPVIRHHLAGLTVSQSRYISNST